jgi:hypothetical protein
MRKPENNTLVLIADEGQKNDIEKFLEYVSGRPLRLTLLRVLPLNWSLPVALLNLCISYQIIFVQFTHVL